MKIGDTIVVTYQPETGRSLGWYYDTPSIEAHLVADQNVSSWGRLFKIQKTGGVNEWWVRPEWCQHTNGPW